MSFKFNVLKIPFRAVRGVVTKIANAFRAILKGFMDAVLKIGAFKADLIVRVINQIKG